jgi:hypothetical protein
LFATVIPKKLASQELDASVGASGPHGFAVRAQRHSSFDVAASIASRTNVRDDRDTSLLRGGMSRDVEVIWAKREPEYFCGEGWTGKSPICPSGNPASAAPRIFRSE